MLTEFQTMIVNYLSRELKLEHKQTQSDEILFTSIEHNIDVNFVHDLIVFTYTAKHDHDYSQFSKDINVDMSDSNNIKMKLDECARAYSSVISDCINARFHYIDSDLDLNELTKSIAI